MLMEVADPKGDWELEVRMPESRMGYISEAVERIGRQAAGDFILATHPANKLEGQVEEIEPSAEVRGDEGNTVLVRVSVRSEDAPRDVSRAEDRRGRDGQDPLRPAVDRLRMAARPGGFHSREDPVPTVRGSTIMMRCSHSDCSRWPMRGRSAVAGRRSQSGGQAADPVLNGCLVKLEEDVKLPAPGGGRARCSLGVKEGSQVRQGEVIGKIDDDEAADAEEGGRVCASAPRTKQATDDVQIRYAEKSAAVAEKNYEMMLEIEPTAPTRRCRKSKCVKAKLEWDAADPVGRKGDARSGAGQVRVPHEEGRARRGRTGDRTPHDRRAVRRRSGRRSIATRTNGSVRAIAILRLVRLDTMHVEGAVEQANTIRTRCKAAT